MIMSLLSYEDQLLKTVQLISKELVRLAPTVVLFAKRKAGLVKADEAPKFHRVVERSLHGFEFARKEVGSI